MANTVQPGVAFTLTSTELLTGAIYGIMRRVSAIHRNRVARYGEPGSDQLWQIDIDSALAEMTVAKYLDRYWEPLMPNGKVDAVKGDVGALSQVRSIRRPTDRLIVHPDDNDLATFYLVYCNAPTYTILGWIRGRDAKQHEWWETFTGRPAYFVPQNALNPCDQGAWTSDFNWATAEDHDLNGNIDA
jgi:hypothetical protein